MRPIWNGNLSFGLLNVPVQIYSAEKSTDLHFRMLDNRNKSPIRYERVNKETGEEVPWKDIVKAFEYSKGNYVVIDEKELRAAAPEATETIDIEAFVPRADINPMYFDKPYYLVPGKKAEKGYVLLRETLRKVDQLGIARVVIRTRQYLSALMPVGNALVLNLMRYSEQLVKPDEVNLPGNASEYRVSQKEMDMAAQLIKSMSNEWQPDDYRDEFKQTVRKLIDARVAKQSGRRAKPSEEYTAPKPATNVVDFMSLLQKSLQSKGAAQRKSTAKTATRRRKTAHA